MATVALLTLGMASCERDDDTTDNPTDPTNPTNPSGGGTDPGTDTTTVSVTAGEWIDLGLPSGLLWRSCNLGAESPEEYGDYYAWGETSTKDEYTNTTYIHFADSIQILLTKYCNKPNLAFNGQADYLTTLEPIDDPSTAVLGLEVHTPTRAQFMELLANTHSEWVRLNGVYGRNYTAGNGNSLFIPAGGCKRGDTISFTETIGCYWTSSLVTTDPLTAWALDLRMDHDTVGRSWRYFGYTIRAVRMQD